MILSIIPTSPDSVNCKKNKEIYLTTNGVHLDIIIPTKYLENNLIEIFNVPASVNYLSFGWGDKGFYLETPTWDQLKFSVAVNAVFFKSETAMHVTQYKYQSDRWSKIELCEEQLHALINYVMDSFAKNNELQIMEIAGAGYFSNDKFYEATGNYSCLRTCNNWVNKGLKKAGVKTSVWSPFDFGVLYHVE
ncbi:MAG: TIGR02117 family protein [Bacteroidota bacterium]